MAKAMEEVSVWLQLTYLAPTVPSILSGHKPYSFCFWLKLFFMAHLPVAVKNQIKIINVRVFPNDLVIWVARHCNAKIRSGIKEKAVLKCDMLLKHAYFHTCV